MVLPRSALALLVVLAGSAVGCAAGAAKEGETTTASDLAETSDAGTDAAPARPTYDAVAVLEGDAFRAGLYDLVKNHHGLGYNAARKVMFAAVAPGFQTTEGKLECVYTGRLATPTGSTAVESFNTEHSWPQSLGAGSEPAKSDMHHLFPVDAHANSARGNFPFGEPLCAATDSSACSFADGGSFMGKDASGHNTFEVRPEKRGDIARAHFYFAIRYNLHIGDTEEAVLRSWSAEDVVDDGEVKRNDAIESYQHNRNPFVDRPEFVAKIADF